MITVLVTGTDGGASQSIIKCLRLAGGYRIIVTGIDPLSIGMYRGNKGYVVSRDWEEYLKEVNEICLREDVELIIPGSDIEVEFLDNNKAWIDTPILITGGKAITVTRDKWLTIRWLKVEGFLYPDTHLGVPLNLKFPKILKFPLIIKPRKGWGSQGQYQVKNLEELKVIKELLRIRGIEEDSLISQELLEGTELSGMVMIAKDGEILGVTCAESEKKYGMSFKTIHGSDKDNLDFKNLAIKVVKRLHARGPISIQAYRTTKGEIKIFEMNPRFTGAQIVRAIAGSNMPDILVKNYLRGEKVYPKINKALIAYWYHDFGYLLPEDYEEVRKTRIVNWRKGYCPKLL